LRQRAFRSLIEGRLLMMLMFADNSGGSA
jgi:hypothetical protein